MSHKTGELIIDKNNVDYTVQRIVNNIPFVITSRRSYGSGAYKTTYTWLSYYDSNTNEWKRYGDPFPKFNPSNAEIAQYLPTL